MVEPHVISAIETCKLNAVDPQAYLASTLAAIVNGHKLSLIDDLLPWSYAVSNARLEPAVGPGFLQKSTEHIIIQ